MSKTNSVVSQARAALDQFKMEAQELLAFKPLLKKAHNI